MTKLNLPLNYNSMRNNDELYSILVETAQIVWSELDLCHLLHLFESMPHRVEAIIESQG